MGKKRNKQTERILSWLGLQFLPPQYKSKKSMEYFGGDRVYLKKNNNGVNLNHLKLKAFIQRSHGQRRCLMLLVQKFKRSPDVPRRVVPVVLTEASIAERVVLPSTRRGRGAARLLGTTPFVWVEGDTRCLVAVRTWRSSGGIAYTLTHRHTCC